MAQVQVIKTHEELYQRNVEPIEKTIKIRKWRWKPPNFIVRRALEWYPQGKCKRGRPKATAWTFSILDELEAINKTWSEVKLTA